MRPDVFINFHQENVSQEIKTEADTEIQLSSSKPTTAIFHKNVIYIQKNELIMIFKHFTFL